MLSSSLCLIAKEDKKEERIIDVKATVTRVAPIKEHMKPGAPLRFQIHLKELNTTYFANIELMGCLSQSMSKKKAATLEVAASSHTIVRCELN